MGPWKDDGRGERNLRPAKALRIAVALSPGTADLQWPEAREPRVRPLQAVRLNCLKLQ